MTPAVTGLAVSGRTGRLGGLMMVAVSGRTGRLGGLTMVAVSGRTGRLGGLMMVAVSGRTGRLGGLMMVAVSGRTGRLGGLPTSAVATAHTGQLPSAAPMRSGPDAEPGSLVAPPVRATGTRRVAAPSAWTFLTALRPSNSTQRRLRNCERYPAIWPK
jgi:hypothetical protein